ncbi:MAG: flavin reductase family protein [Pseudomonadota bacterium]
MFFRPENRDRNLLPHDPFKAIVAPRPIGWISTVSPEGIANLAPYSFFNAVGGMPPMVMFSSEGFKDSARNAAQSQEFVCNYASRSLSEAMNASSIPAPPGVSEFEHFNIKSEPSEFVSPPRVAEAYAALECKVTGVIETVDISGNKTGAVITLGQVVGIHIDEAVIKDGRFDVVLADPITRLGYLDFGYSNAFHERPRPSWP